MAKVFVKDGFYKGSFFEVGNDPLTIGRSPSNRLPLPDYAVSRAHAVIEQTKEGVVVKDLGSKNGTFVNGQKVERAALRPNDEISVRGTVLVFLEDTAAGEPQAAAPIAKVGFGQRVASQICGKLEIDQDAAFSKESQNANLEELRKCHCRLNTLYQVGKTIASSIEITETLSNVMNVIFEVIQPDEALILLKEGGSEKLEPKVIRTKDRRNDLSELGISQTIVGKVLQEGVGLLTEDATTDQRFQEAASIAKFQMKSTMCLPLKSSRGTVGVIQVSNRSSSEKFDEEDLKLMTGIANQAAIAIENARLYAKIQDETKMRSSLQRYLSPNVVEKIMEGSESLELGGKHKKVSVLFSDIRQFTALSEQVSPKELIEMLNEYFSEMTDIVFRFQGAVDKFIGDALVVLFGTPFSDDHDAERAVEVALQMQRYVEKMMAAWAKQGRRTFSIGIGITTGQVMYGNIGSRQRMELTVIGDTVNVASRLASLAGPGEILIDQATRDEVRALFKVEKSSVSRVRGKAEGLSVYEVKGKQVEHGTSQES